MGGGVVVEWRWGGRREWCTGGVGWGEWWHSVVWRRLWSGGVACARLKGVVNPNVAASQ